MSEKNLLAGKRILVTGGGSGLGYSTGCINGEVVTIDGGEWLQGAGQLNFLRWLSEADWTALKPSTSG